MFVVIHHVDLQNVRSQAKRSQARYPAVLPAATEENTFSSQVLSDVENLTKMPAGSSRQERLKEHLSVIKALSAEADRLGDLLDQE